MKQYLLLAILIELSRTGFMTAKKIANKFEISTRSVYRYITALECAGIKTYTLQGKNGGVGIEKDFVLEVFLLSEKEKSIIKQSFEQFKDKTELIEISKKLNLDNTTKTKLN